MMRGMRIPRPVLALLAAGANLCGQDGQAAPLRCLAGSADGVLLATATDTGIAVRSRAEGAKTRELPLPSPPLQLLFAAGGSALLAACRDGGLRSFDLSGGRGPRTLFCGATSIAWQADGSLLYTAGDAQLRSLAPAMLQNSAGSSVDLRPQFERWGLPPRRQGRRGTCSVFTTTAAYEFALARRQDRGEPLSDEFLNWAANAATGRDDDGSFFHDAIAGFEKFGACAAALMPYAADFDPARTPSDAALRDGERVRGLGFTVHWINPWRPQAGLSPEQLQSIQQVLARGWPVALGSSHSTLAVGYADDPAKDGGGELVIRDSATGGHRTLSYAFVLQRIGDVFWVEPRQP